MVAASIRIQHLVPSRTRGHRSVSAKCHPKKTCDSPLQLAARAVLNTLHWRHLARAAVYPDGEEQQGNVSTPKLTVLTEADIEGINSAALQLLERTGMLVPSAQMLGLLAAKGAIVDETGCRVRLPRQMVTEALAAAPKRFHLADRRGGLLDLPTDAHHHLSGSSTLHVLDYETNTLRRPVYEDAVRFTRLADALPLIAAVTPQVSHIEGGRSSQESELRTLQALVCNTSKHCLAAPSSLRLAEAWLEIGEIVADGVCLTERPVVSVLVSPNSPLTWDKESLAVLRLVAGKGVPLVILSVTQAGMSAPLTLAGAQTLTTAETLFGLVLTQLVRPGCPVVFGGVGVTIFDMSAADMAEGGPEYALSNIAGAQVARYYGIPSYSCAAHTDAKCPDQQAGMEKMACMLSALLAGVDMTINAGSLNKTTVSSYEQMIIDHEMLRYLYRCLAVCRRNRRECGWSCQ